MISEIITAMPGEEGYVSLVLIVLAQVVAIIATGLLLLRRVLRDQELSKAKYFVPILVLISTLSLVVALDILEIGNLPTVMIAGAITLAVILTELVFGICDYRKVRYTEIKA